MSLRERVGKKEWERRTLDCLLRLRPMEGIQEIEETEPPDLVIVTHEKRIGVEVTRLFLSGTVNGQPLKERESLQNQVVEQAQQLFVASDQRPVWVTVFFTDQPSLRKQSVGPLAQRIVELVAAANPEPRQEVRLSAFDGIGARQGFPDEVDEMYVSLHSEEMPKPRWWCPRAGQVADYEPPDVQRKIDKKNGRCAEYRKRCDEVWLLMDIDEGHGPSAFIRLTDSAKAATYRSNFDQVFVLWRFGNEVDELKTEAAFRSLEPEP